VSYELIMRMLDERGKSLEFNDFFAAASRCEMWPQFPFSAPLALNVTSGCND